MGGGVWGRVTLEPVDRGREGAANGCRSRKVQNVTDGDNGDSELSGLMSRYGVEDDDSAREAAWAARESIAEVERTVLRSGSFTMSHLMVWGLVARAQSLHEGCVAAIEANNPHAAFTLLRAYAEQCAAVLFMTDHPARAERLWNDPDGRGVKIGVITNHAERSGRMPNFAKLYKQLSGYAHPTTASHFASMRVGQKRSFTWQAAPRFKHDDDKLMAYIWCIELAQAFNRFAFEFAVARGLGSFVPASGEIT